jgi:hypothetical protein
MSTVALVLLLPTLGIYLSLRRRLQEDATAVQLWTRRGLVAGAVFGGCFGNTFLPLFGTIPGLLIGTFIGGLGGFIVALLTQQQTQRMDPELIDRVAKIMSLALIALGMLAGLWFFGRNFDAPVSKYVSKGEYLWLFCSNVLWPGFLLVLYVLLAGPPSSNHPLVGETSKGRRVAIQALVVLSALSSIYIGMFWVADNFPHPD